MTVPFVFMSGHTFGARFLRGILKSNAYRQGALAPVMVLSLHPRHAVDTAGYEDLRFVCSEFDLPATTFDKVTDPHVYEILEGTLHYYNFVIGLSQLVPEDLMLMTSRHSHSQQLYSENHGCIGAHPTLLPKGRGRAPIPWTIVHGEISTGVTSFFLENGVDSGPVIAQEVIQIRPKITATELFELAADAHETLGKEIAPKVASRAVTSKLQNHADATVWEKRQRQHGWIDFHNTAEEIALLVRAVSPPYPSAFFVHCATIVYVLSADTIDIGSAGLTPGQIIAVDDGGIPVVATKQGGLRILAYEAWPERSWSFQVGTVLGSPAKA